MATSRRVFLTGLFGATATACLGQGVVPHKAVAQARSKPSGLPFNSTFTDVAARAGLRAITVYGESDHKNYIVETLGCGCAFLDFDNDGWLDILLLSGTRFTNAPPDASNRLFKNNRDGSFTDVTERAGLLKTGWACGVCVGDYNNDGFDDLFITYWGQNILYRNNGDGTFTDVTRAAGLPESSGR
jgi:enediyne biosynthesis protein E4